MKITPVKPNTKVKFKTRMEESMTLSPWWEEKDKKRAVALCITAAAYLKEGQADKFRKASVYARLYGNQALFSFSGNTTSRMDNTQGLPSERPTFNLVQSCVDTLVSRITQNRPQPVFLTDAADYKQRTLSKKLNNFILGEFHHTKAYEKAAFIFRDALVQGTGVLHVYEDDDERVALERVLITELLTDENEGIYGEPRQIYRLKLIDRKVLYSMFPDRKEEVSQAEKAFPDGSANASKTVSDLVIVVESWHLRSGKKAKDGKHMICCSGGELFSEDYNRDCFPFVFMHYSNRYVGFWSQGIAEQLMGTQVELNSILFTISRSIKLVGVPRVFQEESSKVVSAAHNNEVGVIVKYRGIKPEYEVAPCNAPELYAERDKLIQYGYQQCGVSAMQASSQMPQGLESGEAIRTFDNISTDRFASLGRKFDNFFVDLTYQIVEVAREICQRTDHYSTVYPNKNGTKEIDLRKADFIEDSFIVQCFTQSSLPKDPAGRLQKVTEMVQSGMITIQEGRRLLDFPDLEQVEKLANAAEERIYQVLDDIIETGKYAPPDPFMDLDLASTLTVQYYNLYVPAKLEEKKQQMLRDFQTQVQILQQSAQQQAQAAQNAALQQQVAAQVAVKSAGKANPPQANPEPTPTSPLIPNAAGAA